MILSRPWSENDSLTNLLANTQASHPSGRSLFSTRGAGHKYPNVAAWMEQVEDREDHPRQDPIGGDTYQGRRSKQVGRFENDDGLKPCPDLLRTGEVVR